MEISQESKAQRQELSLFIYFARNYVQMRLMRDWVWLKLITPQSIDELTLEEGGVALTRNSVDETLYTLQIK